MADRVTARLKVDDFNRALDQLKRQAIDPRGFVALALKDVAKNDALPSIRDRTPVDTGRAKRSWKLGHVHLRRKQPYINLIGKDLSGADDFYLPFLEYGTLGRRKKKLKEDTLSRRRQKTTLKRTKKGRISAAQFQSLHESLGGIRPYRMVGGTFRLLRKNQSVAKAMQFHLRRNVRDLKRDVRGVTSG